MKEKVQLELKIISFRNSSSLKKKKKGNKFLSQQYQTSFMLDILTQ